MSYKILLVPIHIDALFLERATLVTSAADFSGLPYRTATADINADRVNLSESVLSQPFQNQNLNLKPGVHLHWALPDALTNGRAMGDGTVDYPAVPNRWIVTKKLNNSSILTQWIVESDYFHPQGEDKTHGSITFPVDITDPSVAAVQAKVGGPQPFYYVGRQLPFEGYNEDSQSNYIDKLTALGYGDPSFAAFYPSCHSVFGCYDKDINKKSELKELIYDVIGWYSNSEQDPISLLMAELSEASVEEKFEAIKTELQWDVNGNSGLPEKICCYATLRFEDAPKYTNKAAQQPLRVVVANSGTEAMAVYLTDEIVGQDKNDDKSMELKKIVEEQLEALELLPMLGKKGLDRGPEFRSAFHAKTFSPESSGELWTIDGKNENKENPIENAYLLKTKEDIERYWVLEINKMVREKVYFTVNRKISRYNLLAYVAALVNCVKVNVIKAIGSDLSDWTSNGDDDYRLFQFCSIVGEQQNVYNMNKNDLRAEFLFDKNKELTVDELDALFEVLKSYDKDKKIENAVKNNIVQFDQVVSVWMEGKITPRVMKIGNTFSTNSTCFYSLLYNYLPFESDAYWYLTKRIRYALNPVQNNGLIRYEIAYPLCKLRAKEIKEYVDKNLPHFGISSKLIKDMENIFSPLSKANIPLCVSDNKKDDHKVIAWRAKIEAIFLKAVSESDCAYLYNKDDYNNVDKVNLRAYLLGKSLLSKRLKCIIEQSISVPGKFDVHEENVFPLFNKIIDVFDYNVSFSGAKDIHEINYRYEFLDILASDDIKEDLSRLKKAQTQDESYIYKCFGGIIDNINYEVLNDTKYKLTANEIIEWDDKKSDKKDEFYKSYIAAKKNRNNDPRLLLLDLYSIQDKCKDMKNVAPDYSKMWFAASNSELARIFIYLLANNQIEKISLTMLQLVGQTNFLPRGEFERAYTRKMVDSLSTPDLETLFKIEKKNNNYLLEPQWSKWFLKLGTGSFIELRKRLYTRFADHLTEKAGLQIDQDGTLSEDNALLLTQALKLRTRVDLMQQQYLNTSYFLNKFISTQKAFEGLADVMIILRKVVWLSENFKEEEKQKFIKALENFNLNRSSLIKTQQILKELQDATKDTYISRISMLLAFIGLCMYFGLGVAAGSAVYQLIWAMFGNFVETTIKSKLDNVLGRIDEKISWTEYVRRVAAAQVSGFISFVYISEIAWFLRCQLYSAEPRDFGKDIFENEGKDFSIKSFEEPFKEAVVLAIQQQLDDKIEKFVDKYIFSTDVEESFNKMLDAIKNIDKELVDCLRQFVGNFAFNMFKALEFFGLKAVFGDRAPADIERDRVYQG